MGRYRIILKSTAMGLSGTIVLLGVYFLVLTGVSGWEFTLGQFVDF